MTEPTFDPANPVLDNLSSQVDVRHSITQAVPNDKTQNIGMSAIEKSMIESAINNLAIVKTSAANCSHVSVVETILCISTPDTDVHLLLPHNNVILSAGKYKFRIHH